MLNARPMSHPPRCQFGWRPEVRKSRKSRNAGKFNEKSRKTRNVIKKYGCHANSQEQRLAARGPKIKKIKKYTKTKWKIKKTRDGIKKYGCPASSQEQRLAARGPKIKKIKKCRKTQWKIKKNTKRNQEIRQPCSSCLGLLDFLARQPLLVEVGRATVFLVSVTRFS